ncbi:SAM-dependent methyltransferase [Actinomadura luteofluorescens]|uniref:class I SAM-dependent methyltransferase n=1 Tax=Actinomadura luteofluorescens TaxID=46163 RepID=UPI002164DED2|nr:class I SAM-dependent methyltransferase [Actinomadura glauciflava]MCR3744296.1 methyltransferase, TIGR00027 family [Actinomadura glauciflava]
MDKTEGSRTAVLVCQARAVAHGRLAPDRFADPTASALLRPDELAAVERVRSGVPPEGWGPRMEYEFLRATAEGLVPRTVAIDDAVRERTSPQVVILGAGLDGRAWRMPELAGTAVFEVDHPRSQEDKRQRAAALSSPPGEVVFVPVDFTADRLDDSLKAAGHRADLPTTWIWEGVVPYLTRAEVAATVRDLAGASAPGSGLVVNYQSPSPAASLGRLLTRAMRRPSRRPDPMAHEPWRSAWTPAAMRELLTGQGFAVAGDTDLLTLAGALAMPVRGRRSPGSGRVLVADRQAG